MNTGGRATLWVWLLVLGLAVASLVSLTRYTYRVQQLERLHRVVATQNALLQATRAALSRQLTATPDPQELERLWRERTGQVRPGELPVRVVPPDTVLPPQQPPLPPPQTPPPWLAWWLLFFGPAQGP